MDGSTAVSLPAPAPMERPPFKSKTNLRLSEPGSAEEKKSTTPPPAQSQPPGLGRPPAASLDQPRGEFPSRPGARAGHSFGAAPRPSQREPQALRGRHRRRRRRGPRPAAAAESLRLRGAAAARPAVRARDAPPVAGRRAGDGAVPPGPRREAHRQGRRHDQGPTTEVRAPASRSTRTIRRASLD